ncbi:1-(5-phosphoribosyl)-5-[(5-phosphoribosylamino)methylideneamino]imidazole-4-carboxamide isomerase [Serpentinicella alkaliphila]|uniref:1-(5-phosphoribosyl)-5-[(5-phosphoribosylamino)methylideneamino] imidazole-4-carboxamide isomerase n=1 Tax=Serpentinicella alkaliphila TaxID=1734049 RepID=A0A4R2TH68_9FIRM|nr:1-(5-phosphoribosyl)-5-[(5-phosphoribosylamino)methylideneamino]imidazole-4-carboxamide isomerase [Serpentinicella alkaliphila]QUH24998.1 1-(5-phosphoribosyl)-5-[(5-phosphoribosylamino)methylideneamino]imidazole-4-carboxamide isomerase [Serpentinicella alkaliphila]TCQ02521.1 1-(5-phosphoribosyl)-5-[(5-phosphoribosylamino)methylideneamino] imidazole-4-carboxamide isomerase [Serpentinicella alkaliphila]
MVIYPAIDIKDGKCVRLTQGKKDEEIIYFEKPEDVAIMWEKKGAKILHIVDLDGAFDGVSKNLEQIKRIREVVNIPIQVGGGIRSLEVMNNLFNVGVNRVILGTKALQDKDMLKEAVNSYGDKIIVSIDAHNGYVAIDGWTKTSEVSAVDFAREMEELGVKTIVYTDIARDGMLKGPNFEAINYLKDRVNIDIIASGGVSSEDDLVKLKEIGVAGAIVGKALYEGRVDLEKIEVK